ncbi:MAG: coniferyl-alcohol dehydrogenase [Devosia sp.]|nr:coniferyl-alcohol dehydrogenase [Devosia sp.]
MLFGKTIVVTGAASGIGARTAELCAGLGADIIGIDVKEPRQPLAGFIQGDLSTALGVAEIAARLPLRIDALCNVAGLSGAPGAVPTVAVNFYGLRALSEAAAPHIREGGAIVNVASIAGYGWRANLNRAKSMVAIAGFPDVAAVLKQHDVAEAEGYPLSKELLLLWTQLAAQQPLFKSRGIRVVSVSPGPVETPILGQFRQVFGDARVDADIAATGRAGTASDIAPVIAFLCSDGARWINGTNIAADGGLEAAVNAQTLGY